MDKAEQMTDKRPDHAIDIVKYSSYINDEAIVKSLRLPRVTREDWPTTPAGWSPGDEWPTLDDWDHNEVLFIRTHQAFEVWFAQITHELASVVSDFSQTWLNNTASELPRVDLADRGGSEQLLDSEGFELSKRAVAEAKENYPGLTSAFDGLLRPGCRGISRDLDQIVGFRGSYGESDEFDYKLVGYTRRIQRASKALLCTLEFFEVLATMTTEEFLRFRGRLQPSSGFGSTQFREIELLAGLRELTEPKLRPVNGAECEYDGMLKPTPETPFHQHGTSLYNALTPWGCERVAKRFGQNSLRDVVYTLLNALYKAGAAGEKGAPDMRHAAVDQFVAMNIGEVLKEHFRFAGEAAKEPTAAGNLSGRLHQLAASLANIETLSAAFTEMMKDTERISQFLAACLEFDSALLQWRDRHIRFVESMIGTRRGTGGGGIAYLKQTVAAEKAMCFTHAFPCLWEARTFVQKGIYR